MKQHCVRSRMMLLIYVFIVTTFAKRGGHASLRKESSSLLQLWMLFREERHWPSLREIWIQQISKAATLYVRALLGGIKRALEVYRRVDDTINNYPWSLPTTEELWHSHAEGVLMVPLTKWTCLKRHGEMRDSYGLFPIVGLSWLMLAYRLLSPALSVEEAGLMTCLQTPPDAGPSVTQATTDWFRFVGGCQQQINSTSLLSRFWVSTLQLTRRWALRSAEVERHAMPMMNPSPTEIV